MKRRSNLFDEACSYYNIREAFLKAIRGKRSSVEVILFCRNINDNLEKVRQRMLSDTVEWGPYRSFIITDPKTRVISAAPLEDRIIHHALVNLLEPVFERQFIYHTYACRNGRGTHAAVRYAFSRCKAQPYFLKLDVRKYFDSIDHIVLKRLLARIIKDERMVLMLFGIIDSYHTTEGAGVPIGNLTSQFFANLYLSGMDHVILERLRPKGYVRYMDDFVLWDSDKARLKTMLESVERYAADNLRLVLKPPVLGSTLQGVPFLGFRIRSGGIYLLRKSKQRIITRMRSIHAAFAAGSISEETVTERITSVHAAVLLARARSFLVQWRYGRRFGQQPRETRGELEQQYAERTLCQP
jgi:retron-type reverse transcriptase